jgi:hypothetical protein
MLLSRFDFFFILINDRATVRTGSVIAHFYQLAAMRAFLILSGAIVADISKVAVLLICRDDTFVVVVVVAVLALHIVLVKAVATHPALNAVLIMNKVHIVIAIQLITFFAVAVILTAIIANVSSISRRINAVIWIPLVTVLALRIVAISAVLTDHERPAPTVVYLVQFLACVILTVFAVVFFVIVAQTAIAVELGVDFVTAADTQTGCPNLKSLIIVLTVTPDADVSIEVFISPVGVAAKVLVLENLRREVTAAKVAGFPQVRHFFQHGDFTLD